MIFGQIEKIPATQKLLMYMKKKISTRNIINEFIMQFRNRNLSYYINDHVPLV